MGILHLYWRFVVADATRVLGRYMNRHDLFDPDTTALVQAIRDDPVHSRDLEALRLSRTDQEVWATILRPSSADRGYGTAARPARCLCRRSRTSTPCPYLEDSWAAAGWSPDAIRLAIWGRGGVWIIPE